MAEAEPQASSRIFISYRREDAIAHVNALFHPLRERFGEDRIFKDTDSIAPGQDFLKVIQRELESCSVLLAVIGKQWLTVQKPKSNARRLDDPSDYLRVEVATALKNENVRVIPILVGHASMPTPEDLPADLAELAHRNGFELRDSRWDADVRLLIQAIERASGEPASARPRPPPVPLSGPPPPAPPRADASPPSQQSDEFDLLEGRRKRQIAEHMKVARQAFEALDYEAVLEACERAVWLDAQHGEARDLSRRARTALDEQRIQGWLAQAQQLLAREELADADLATASELIDQALSLNATHEAAVKLRQAMLAVRKRRERQREVDRHVRAALVRAQASFEDEDFDAAIDHCDDALAVFGESAEAVELRSKAVAAKDDERRQRELKRRAQQVVKEARAEFAAGQQEAALARLERFSPTHDLITRALEELRKELQSITQARAERLERERVEAARREAEAARRQAETEHRRRELTAATARIEDLLGRGELDTAEQALATADHSFASPAELGPLHQRLDTLRRQALQDELARKATLEAAAEEQRQAARESAAKEEAARRTREEAERERAVAERRQRDEAERKLRAEADRRAQEAAGAKERERKRQEADQHRRAEAAATEKRRAAEARAEEEREHDRAARVREAHEQEQRVLGEAALQQTAADSQHTMVAAATIAGPKLYLSAAAVLGLIVLVSVLLMRQSPGPATQPEPTTTAPPAAPAPAAPPPPAFPVRIDAVPWAQVRITRLSDGSAVVVDEPTPLLVQLPAGEYSVQLANPMLATPATQKLTVVPNGDNTLQVTLPGIDANRIVDELLPR